MNPKASFIILTTDRLSDLSREALDLLYQPILLPDAYALVNLLWRLGQLNVRNSLQRPVTDLLSFLSIDQKTFDRARQRLEGAGLLKTFCRKNLHQVLYVYKLIAPLTPRRFYNDDLLSVYLLETIGAVHYRELNQHLVPKQPSLGRDFQNITKNFLQVFTVNHQDLTQTPLIIRKLSSKSASDRDRYPSINDEGFDFQLLLRILKDSFVNVSDIQRFKRLILSEHEIYGLDEVAMARYLEEAASVTNNRVNFKRFKLAIANAFQQRGKQASRLNLSKQPVNSSQITLADKERRLVEIVDNYSPMDFLRSLKERVYHTSIVTYKEMAAVQGTMNYGAFRDNRGVINILIYYMIVDYRMTSLNADFMDRVVNSWTVAHVNTPQEAIQEIKKFKKSKQKKWRQYAKHEYHRYGRYQHKPIKEALPKWAKKGYQPRLRKPSRSLQKAVQKDLRMLEKNQSKRNRDELR